MTLFEWLGYGLFAIFVVQIMFWVGDWVFYRKDKK
jgi:hypothetical protein